MQLWPRVDIEEFSYRFVNEDTLAALQIFRTESSPNVHSHGPSKGASGGKEGLSVFGLFQGFARTPQGKQIMKQYFSRPSLDLDIITGRLDGISVFLKSDNEEVMKAISKNLAHIRNVRVVVNDLKKGISNASTKQGMRSSVWAALRLVESLPSKNHVLT